MNWLARLLGAERVTTMPDAPQGPQPGDRTVSCYCESDKPMLVMFNLHSFVIRGGQLVEFVTGRRVQCEDCGEVFSIGPHGRFRPHKAGRAEKAPSVGAAPAESAPPPPRVPLERSRV